MPHWWTPAEQGASPEPMFVNPTSDQSKWCSSTCFSTTGQKFEDDFAGVLTISYDDMIPSCASGTEIKIVCLGFKNPIYKKEWDGFKLSTYDSQYSADESPKKIEESADLIFDTREFSEHLMSESDFTIMPGNTVINSESEWDFGIKLHFPLEQFCLIQITFPSDLGFAVNSVRGSQSFEPMGGEILIREDFAPLPDEDSIVFFSCKNPSSLSGTPAGKLYVSNIVTPGQIKDSGEFFVKIYRG